MKVRDLAQYSASFITSVWVGGIWVMGYLAVPLLFETLPDRQLAGMLAGKMLSGMAWLGIACAFYLAALQFYQSGRLAWQQKSLWIILAMLLLLAVGQFVIQPIMADLKFQALPLDVMQSDFAGAFKKWHGCASVLYLVQSLLGLILVASPSVSRH